MWSSILFVVLRLKVVRERFLGRQCYHPMHALRRPEEPVRRQPYLCIPIDIAMGKLAYIVAGLKIFLLATHLIVNSHHTQLIGQKLLLLPGNSA